MLVFIVCSCTTFGCISNGLIHIPPFFHSFFQELREKYEILYRAGEEAVKRWHISKKW